MILSKRPPVLRGQNLLLSKVVFNDRFDCLSQTDSKHSNKNIFQKFLDLHLKKYLEEIIYLYITIYFKAILESKYLNLSKQQKTVIQSGKLFSTPIA